MRILSKPNANQLTDYWQSFQSETRKIYNSRLFSVAGMSGHAIDGGCILALCCDERVLIKEARIGLNKATLVSWHPNLRLASQWTCWDAGRLSEP